MMDMNKIVAILINDLDSTALYIEELPPHHRYTDALVAVQAAKQALIDGRSDLHQNDMKERFAKMDHATTRRGDELEPRATTLAQAASSMSERRGTGNAPMADRRVPRNAPVQQPKMGHAYDAPWFIGYGYFKTYNVPDEFTDLFWTRHSNLSMEDYILRTHVESRGIPRVLSMCYTLDDNNCSWTLDIKRCPAELRKFYPTFPLKYSPKEWDEGNIRETWYKKLYYWMEDAGEYRLRHAALAWHVEETK